MLRGRIDSAAKKSFLHCAHPKNYVIPPLLPPQRPQLSHRPRAIHRNGSSRPSGSAAALEAPVCALKPLFSQPHSAHNTLNRRGEGAVVATAASAWRPWDLASGLASGIAEPWDKLALLRFVGGAPVQAFAFRALGKANTPRLWGHLLSHSCHLAHHFVANGRAVYFQIKKKEGRRGGA